MRIGSLFSGIGGLELGLERAGVGEVAWQVENDPFCRLILEKHWPEVRRFEDVTQPREYPHVDLICGGFPCQDVSSAGKRRGLGGAKSGLWYYFAAIVEQARPRFVVVENVASGAKKWLPTVRRDLHLLGYRTRAFALSAEGVGAPHVRRRIFVVADAECVQLREQSRRQRRPHRQNKILPRCARCARCARAARSDGDANVHGEPALAVDGKVARLLGMAKGASAWTAAPELRRVDDGILHRVDRLRALGNAVVPQCAEVIGQIIKEIA